MRKKKIRGHKRRWEDIENWRLNNLDFDVADYLLNQSDRFYSKIWVHPWSGLSFTNSEPPEPNGKTKQKMLNGLVDIYEDWKNKLDELGKPYYLKVWLFEPRFSKSQVVCATGENIDFYKNTFFKPEKTIKLNTDNYGHLKSRLENFTWDYRFDEDHYDNTQIGVPEDYASRQDYEDSKRWFEKLLKTPYRIHKFKEPIGDMTESYSFKRGEMWLGEMK